MATNDECISDDDCQPPFYRFYMEGECRIVKTLFGTFRSNTGTCVERVDYTYLGGGIIAVAIFGLLVCTVFGVVLSNQLADGNDRPSTHPLTPQRRHQSPR